MTNPIARDLSQSSLGRSQSRRGNRRNEDAFPRFCTGGFLAGTQRQLSCEGRDRQFHSRNMSLGEAQPIGGARARFGQIVERALVYTSNPRRLAESAPQRLKRLNHRPDVTVLENQASVLSCSSDNDIDHGLGQFVGLNHLVRKQYPKRG
jgi:hypothetical protein